MKIPATILALLVLFLSTQCISMSGNAGKVKEEKCCSRNKPCKKETEPLKDEACNNTCNPFMVCSGCLYILTVKEIFFLQALKDDPAKTGFKQVFLHYDYNAACWHPPETA